MDRFFRKELQIKEIYASISEWVTMILIASVQLHFLYQIVQNGALYSEQTLKFTLSTVALLLIVGYYFTHKASLAKIRIRLQHTTTIQFLAINDLLLITSTLIGTFAIHYAKLWVNLPPIIIGSFITIIASMALNFRGKEILKSCDFAFYAGIFTGLTANFNDSISHLAIASLFTGVLYILSKNLLVGIGGRLGSFAFVAIWLTTLIF